MLITIHKEDLHKALILSEKIDHTRTSQDHFIEINSIDGSLGEHSILCEECLERVGEKGKKKEKQKGTRRRGQEKKKKIIICDFTKQKIR